MIDICHKDHLHIKNSPPFFGRKVFTITDLQKEEAFNIINKVRLFRSGFGYSIKNQNKEEYDNLIKTKVEPKYEEMKKIILEENLLSPIMLYGFYKTVTENDTLYIIDENEKKIPLPLERMKEPPNKSIVDFFNKEADTIGLTLVSLSSIYDKYIKKLYEESEYKDYYFFYALGTYLIESLSDILETHMESLLKLENTNKEKTNKTHIGARYSFGYKALSNLYGNKIIFDMLKPDNDQVILTESYMMEPEISTCAIVSFCEEAHYFAK